MRRRLLIAAVAAAALAGCGGDDNEGVATSTPRDPGRSTPAKPGGIVDVSMRDIKFIPHDVTVRTGQTIRWRNDDGVPHTVTATEGAKFDSNTVQPGGTYERSFTKPGRIAYVCTLHPNQDGTIIVR